MNTGVSSVLRSESDCFHYFRFPCRICEQNFKVVHRLSKLVLSLFLRPVNSKSQLQNLLGSQCKLLSLSGLKTFLPAFREWNRPCVTRLCHTVFFTDESKMVCGFEVGIFWASNSVVLRSSRIR